MAHRIDIVFQPEVLTVVAAIFGLITLLLAAAVYPALRRTKSNETGRRDPDVEDDRMGPVREAEEDRDQDERNLDERIDHFIADAYREGVELERRERHAREHSE